MLQEKYPGPVRIIKNLAHRAAENFLYSSAALHCLRGSLWAAF